MKKENIKIGDTFWRVYDGEALDYVVGWIGEKSVIIANYEVHQEDAIQVDFHDMYPTKEAAEKSIKGEKK